MNVYNCINAEMEKWKKEVPLFYFIKFFGKQNKYGMLRFYDIKTLSVTCKF